MLLRLLALYAAAALQRELDETREDAALHARIASSERPALCERHLLHPNAPPLPEYFDVREQVLQLELKWLHLDRRAPSIGLAFQRLGADLGAVRVGGCMCGGGGG